MINYFLITLTEFVKFHSVFHVGLTKILTQQQLLTKPVLLIYHLEGIFAAK